MNLLTDTLAALFVLCGLFFFIVGAVGIVRMPDFYHRCHAATKCSTVGLMGLLLGVMFHLGSGNVAAKAIAVLVFIFVASPIGSHMLAKAALQARCRQWSGTLSDEHHEDGRV